MNKTVKIILAAIIILVIIIVGILIHNKSSDTKSIEVLDGNGEVYSWVDYELYSQWINLYDPDVEDAAQLGINDKIIRFTNVSGFSGDLNYSVPEGTDTINIPDTEIVFETEGNEIIQSVSFQEILTDSNSYIPLLKVIAKDSNDENTIIYFVRFEDMGNLPEDFSSEFN